MVPDALTSNALSYSSPGASDTSESGSQANCYDGNDGTAFSYYGHHGGDGLTKAFHEKLSEAILAMSKIAFVKSDYEMKKDLESVHGKELTKLIMLLRHGKIALAYQSIWKSVRPVGRDETFYVEGKGE